ncbi:hypothetical protein [Phenylobacterium sp.]|uniref:hypothetical protein n=1 Tax=Phenylobacterium sp. TaxID=1871053 RepID=UPI0025F155DA|nr:hypothetical protein [Phenylobacterium sp.]
MTEPTTVDGVTVVGTPPTYNWNSFPTQAPNPDPSSLPWVIQWVARSNHSVDFAYNAVDTSAVTFDANVSTVYQFLMKMPAQARYINLSLGNDASTVNVDVVDVPGSTNNQTPLDLGMSENRWLFKFVSSTISGEAAETIFSNGKYIVHIDAQKIMTDTPRFGAVMDDTELGYILAHEMGHANKTSLALATHFNSDGTWSQYE